MSARHRGTTVFQLRDGALYDYLRPALAALTLDNIAVALSREPRFVGATKRTYRVGQHCVLGARLLLPDQPAARYFQLHDAHEVVMKDQPTPYKNAVQAVCDRHHLSLNPLDYVNEQARLAVCAKFNLPRGEPAIVRLMDQHLLALEREQLLERTPELDEFWKSEARVAKVKGFPEIEITPWDEATTYVEFMNLARELFPRHA